VPGRVRDLGERYSMVAGPMSFGVGVREAPEPRPAAAGDTFGNLRLVEPVDAALLAGTVDGIRRQFPYMGAVWICECVGCGRRIVTAERWVRSGWTQCENWSPGCRSSAVRHAHPSADDAEAELAPEQSAVWSRMIFPPHDDLHARLAAMRARVKR
jgi:hypothetical protein